VPLTTIAFRLTEGELPAAEMLGVVEQIDPYRIQGRIHEDMTTGLQFPD
jgi:hypothetical protein